MKIIKKIDFKCIEINFEYENQVITIKEKPYKTLEYVKEKAINKIINLPQNIHFYYLGKDISENDSEKIGDFFKHKEKVTIKMKPLEKSLFLNSPKNIIHNFNKNINVINYKEPQIDGGRRQRSVGTHKNQKEIKIVKLIGENKNRMKIDDFNKSLFPRNRSESNLPILQSISLNSNSNKTINNKRIKNVNLKDVELQCSCGKHNVSDYCRNCKKFICFECKTEQKHKNHLTIHLNMYNIEENVKNYGKLIQDDIQNKIEMNKNIFSKNEIIEDDILESRRKIIFEKYQEAIKTYQKIMSSVNTKLKKEDKERSSLVINAYNDLSQKMNKQLLELLDKLNNNYINCNRKIMFNDLRSFFDQINSKEETLSFLGKDIIKYHLKSLINTKLKSSLDKIDRVLDEMTNENNPFNLDYKYYEELVKINSSTKIRNDNLNINVIQDEKNINK